jgi:hypothetical protein
VLLLTSSIERTPSSAFAQSHTQFTTDGRRGRRLFWDVSLVDDFSSRRSIQLKITNRTAALTCDWRVQLKKEASERAGRPHPPGGSPEEHRGHVQRTPRNTRPALPRHCAAAHAPTARVDNALASIVDQPTKLRIRSVTIVALGVERRRRAPQSERAPLVITSGRQPVVVEGPPARKLDAPQRVAILYASRESGEIR